MIRLLSQREPQPTAAWKLLWPDPEQMPRLAAKFAAAVPEHRAALSARYSKVVSSIRVGNTWKRTRPSRLHATFDALAQALGDPPLRELRLMDLGASDGVTTAELVAALREHGVEQVSALLVDLHLELRRRDGRLLREYSAGNDSPVLVRWGPFGLPLDSVRQSRDPLSRWLGNWYLKRRDRAPMKPGEGILLVNPVAAEDAAIEPVEWNAFRRNDEWLDSLDLVRAANFLNLQYFEPERIAEAIAHIHGYLRDGGILIVSRDDGEQAEATVHGTIWRKQGEAFTTLHEFGQGAEIRTIVDGFSAATAPASH